MAKELTNENFNASIIENSGVALVDFWAEWCGPCKLIGPVIEELSTEYDGKATIGKLNVDDNRDVAAQYGIMSIPTLLFFKGGELVDKHVGLASKSDLKKKLDSLIA
ncbi:MAG: thioredoxin [Sphingobacteriales bacterium]|jgi:thioredoxin 1|nr:MAG: thioredoxin [Sphingobacteriales bacterium]